MNTFTDTLRLIIVLFKVIDANQARRAIGATHVLVDIPHALLAQSLATFGFVKLTNRGRGSDATGSPAAVFCGPLLRTFSNTVGASTDQLWLFGAIMLLVEAQLFRA